MATGEVSSTQEIPESKGIFVSGENPLRLSVYIFIRVMGSTYS